MKRILLLLSGFFLLLLATPAHSQRPQKVLGAGEGAGFKAPYNQVAGTTVTLNRDTVYVLTGFYYVDSLATLNIQAGTVILGDSATAGTLIIRRGGKIYAEGTAMDPIVFTSRKPVGQRSRGDWGGVVILGNAPVNKPNPVIEGGIVAGTYGGNDPDDNSGVFRYVRIEYPGIVFQINNEINGLTLGGVGGGTQVDHVQVSYSNDDSFEFFGGTVNAKCLVALGGTDDEFDTDFGHSGKIQFAFGLRDPNVWDAAGQSNGFESDNDDPPTLDVPRTSTVFSNVTLVGPQADTSVALPVGNKFERAALLRRNTRMSVHNSILMGYPFGIEIRNDSTAKGALDGNLQVRNVSLQARTNVVTKQSSSVTIPFDPAAWFTTSGWNNLGSVARRPVDIGLVDAFNLANPDPRPSPSSEPATAGTDYSSAQLDPAFFMPVSYRGAFDPSLPRSSQWDAGWTNYAPQTTDYAYAPTTDVSGFTAVPTLANLQQNYPNPFNPATSIGYALPVGTKVSLKVYDMLGREVMTLVDQFQHAGTYTVNFDARNLSTGMYLYRLSAGSFNEVRKMTLVK